MGLGIVLTSTAHPPQAYIENIAQDKGVRLGIKLGGLLGLIYSRTSFVASIK